MLFFTFFSILFSLFYLILNQEPSCKENENFCKQCDTETGLCKQCLSVSFKPDKEGGCIGRKICLESFNYCTECDSSNDLCDKCEKNYYPDLNGGCSSSDNCLISSDGICNVCTENYTTYKFNQSYTLCKSIYSDDYLHCLKIDQEGRCKKCDKYYILRYDGICIPENCVKFTKDLCDVCSYGYFVDKSDHSRCKSMYVNDNMLYCESSDDGENCTKCAPSVFFTEDKKCSVSNHCAVRKIGSMDCQKCSEGYYPSKNSGYFCAVSDGCSGGYTNTGKCFSCENGFYLNQLEGSCASNKEDNDYKNCLKSNGSCYSCISNFFLSDDNKCSPTKNCLRVNNGECTKCNETFYLTSKDHFCVDVQYCVKSNGNYGCSECDEIFVYNQKNKECVLEEKVEEKFKNCKITDVDGEKCQECRENYYLNLKDNICYSNKEEDKYLKCTEVNSEGKCSKCSAGFFLGSSDSKCVSVEECSEREENDVNKCIKCNKWYCLNYGTGKCIYTQRIENGDNGVCYNCLETNSDGSKCKECLDGYELSEKTGLCVDKEHCAEEEENGDCIVCKQNFIDEKNYRYVDYCLNNNYGCIEFYVEGCKICDNNEDLDECTECFDGYFLDEGMCSKCKEGCVTCSTEDDCGKCGEGFFTVMEASSEESFDAVCEECVEGCKKCENDIACIECLPGYFLSNELSDEGTLLCSPCSDGCKECYDENYCLTCEEGFEFVISEDKIGCKQI